MFSLFEIRTPTLLRAWSLGRIEGASASCGQHRAHKRRRRRKTIAALGGAKQSKRFVYLQPDPRGRPAFYQRKTPTIRRSNKQKLAANKKTCTRGFASFMVSHSKEQQEQKRRQDVPLWLFCDRPSSARMQPVPTASQRRRDPSPLSSIAQPLSCTAVPLTRGAKKKQQRLTY